MVRPNRLEQPGFAHFGNFLILIHSADVFKKSCQAPKIAKFLPSRSFGS